MHTSGQLAIHESAEAIAVLAAEVAGHMFGEPAQELADQFEFLGLIGANTNPRFRFRCSGTGAR